MSDNAQTLTTNGHVQGDQTAPATPAAPAKPATPTAPINPVVEEPGVEEVVPAQSPSEEPEEESFEGTDAADPQA